MWSCQCVNSSEPQHAVSSHRTFDVLIKKKVLWNLFILPLRYSFFSTLPLAGWYAVGSSHLLWLWIKAGKKKKSNKRYASVLTTSHADDDDDALSKKAPQGHVDKEANIFFGPCGWSDMTGKKNCQCLLLYHFERKTLIICSWKNFIHYSKKNN